MEHAACVAHRIAWHGLHKLGQDRMLFQHIRDLARGQGLLELGNPGDTPNKRRRNCVSFSFMRTFVCKRALRSLWGVGTKRLVKIVDAALASATAPPLDMRYLSKKHERPKVIYSTVSQYLGEVYESEAETLPEDTQDDSIHWWVDVMEDIDNSDPLRVVSVKAGHTAHPAGVDTRWLPPGSPFEYWQQYRSAFKDFKCSFRYVLCVWKSDWAQLLKFCAHGQHAICADCVKHKLVIRQLAGDAVSTSAGKEEVFGFQMSQTVRCFCNVSSSISIQISIYTCVPMKLSSCGLICPCPAFGQTQSRFQPLL